MFLASALPASADPTADSKAPVTLVGAGLSISAPGDAGNLGTQSGAPAGPITKVGTATYAANDPADLTGVSPVVTAIAITGDNTATWNPTIRVAVAADMAAGVYIGTITHSVS